MYKALRWVFSFEIPEISAKWRYLMHAYALIVSLFFVSIANTLSLHFYNVLTLTGDSGVPTFKYVIELLERLDENIVMKYGLIAWILFFTIYRAYIAFKGYWQYERNLGKPLDLREMLTIALMNIINSLATPTLIFLGFWIASLNGIDGFNLLVSLVALADGWVRAVPTLVSLPGWAAMICSWFLITFMHYWLHRLAHTRRALWLLLHRPHHISEHLTMVTIAPVISSFPVWILLVIPYTFLFGAAVKLFYPEPLYAEYIVWNLFWMVIQTYSHSAALYEEGVKKPWLVFMSNVNVDGLYHVLHHSSALDAERKANNNTVNIGPGVFACWDRLFGTYQPLLPKVPSMGLTGQPPLVMNPVRLVCAGAMQLVYELYSNRKPLMWWKIMTGPSSWEPPVSKDFALHERL